MIKAPLAFLEVDEEAIPTHAVEFGEPGLGEAPEAFDAIDVVLASGELVGLMIDAMVAIAGSDQAVVSKPAVGIHIAFAQHMPVDDGLQLLARAVLDDRYENLGAALVQTEHRRFATRSTPAFAAHAAGAKVALVDFDLTGEGAQLCQGQRDNAFTPESVKSMDGAVIEHAKISHRESRNVRSEEPKHLAELALRNARLKNVFVCHCG